MHWSGNMRPAGTTAAGTRQARQWQTAGGGGAGCSWSLAGPLGCSQPCSLLPRSARKQVGALSATLSSSRVKLCALVRTDLWTVRFKAECALWALLEVQGVGGRGAFCSRQLHHALWAPCCWRHRAGRAAAQAQSGTSLSYSLTASLNQMKSTIPAGRRVMMSCLL